MAKVDQAPFTVSQADYEAGKFLGTINFASYAATDVGTNAGAVLAIQNNLDRVLPLVKGKIYGQLSVNAGTPTYATADQLIALLHFAHQR